MLVDCVLHQQQISGFEKQSMEAGAEWEGRQATSPQANDSRSPSPCLLQQCRPIFLLMITWLCYALFVQCSSRFGIFAYALILLLIRYFVNQTVLPKSRNL